MVIWGHAGAAITLQHVHGGRGCQVCGARGGTRPVVRIELKRRGGTGRTRSEDAEHEVVEEVMLAQDPRGVPSHPSFRGQPEVSVAAKEGDLTRCLRAQCLWGGRAAELWSPARLLVGARVPRMQARVVLINHALSGALLPSPVPKAAALLIGSPGRCTPHTPPLPLEGIVKTVKRCGRACAHPMYV